MTRVVAIVLTVRQSTIDCRVEVFLDAVCVQLYSKFADRSWIYIMIPYVVVDILTYS